MMPVPPIAPAEEDLRMFARILLHLSRQPRFEPGETVPASLTQDGMASELGTSRAAVSSALLRLINGGAVEVHRGHVSGKAQRLKIYQLSPLGEEAARHIRESIERIGARPTPRAPRARSWGIDLRPTPE